MNHFLKLLTVAFIVLSGSSAVEADGADSVLTAAINVRVLHDVDLAAPDGTQHGRERHQSALVSRSLQTSAVALACKTEGNAVTSCANATMTPQENLDCGACIVSAQNSTDALAELMAANFTCAAYTSYVCDALSACPCADPCSQVVADYQECVLVETYSQAGVAFKCDISCGSSSGGGGGSTGGTSDGGFGTRTSSKASAAAASALLAYAGVLAVA